MTIFIAGGSNSLMKTGWVSYFLKHHPEAVNLSVGASTSIMALFRVMSTPELGPGDTLVWEYALNEAMHVRNEHRPELLLRHLEHLLHYCASRDVAVAPVIFTPYWVEKLPERIPFYGRLRALLAHYGLRPFDMSLALRQARKIKTLPRSVYADEVHYHHTAPVLTFIASGANRAVAQARVPRARVPLYTGIREMVLLNSFTTGAFENSVMRIASAPPPVAARMPRNGALEAIFYMTTKTPGVFEVRAGLGDEAIAISTRSRPGAPTPHMLKSALFRVFLGRAWPVPRGTFMTVSPRARPAQLNPGFAFAPRPDGDDIHIAGIMIETILPRHTRLVRRLMPDHLRHRLRRAMARG